MNDSVVAKRKMKQKLTSFYFQYIYYYYILESYNQSNVCYNAQTYPDETYIP